MAFLKLENQGHLKAVPVFDSLEFRSSHRHFKLKFSGTCWSLRDIPGQVPIHFRRINCAQCKSVAIHKRYGRVASRRVKKIVGNGFNLFS